MRTLMTDRLGRIRDHLDVWRDVWNARHRTTRAERDADQMAFLPAHLELIEKPVSPAARRLAWAIAALFCLALGWSIIGRVDIIASAPGKSVAASRTKVIQAIETAIVRHIAVRDGDRVRVGDLLLELDEATNTAEGKQAREALNAARVAIDRHEVVMNAIEAGRLPTETASRSPRALELAAFDFTHFRTRLDTLQATLDQRRHEAATVKASVSPLEASLRIAAKRRDDTARLRAGHHVAEHEFLLREQEWLESERVLAGQRARMTELTAAIAAATHELESHVATTKQQTAEQLRQAHESAAQFEQDVARTTKRSEQLSLRSPVDGTIQQLSVHTIGGVVTPGQDLLMVVPENDPLEIEASILNQDIGFVRVGQRVTVKIESFPYTRYGFIEGAVESVSHDAAQDEKLGLVFPMRVRLDRTALNIDGVDVNLTAGMNVTVEVKTGQRRLIDYLVDPLKVHINEAARDR